MPSRSPSVAADARSPLADSCRPRLASCALAGHCVDLPDCHLTRGLLPGPARDRICRSGERWRTGGDRRGITNMSAFDVRIHAIRLLRSGRLTTSRLRPQPALSPDLYTRVAHPPPA